MTDLDLTILEVTPPWEWPNDAAEAVLKRLRDNQGDEAERLLAAELAGEIVIVSQDLTKALSAIVADRGASDELRGRAAIALGPVLEEMDLHEPLGDELDELDPPPIPPHEFQRIRWELQAVYRAADTPKEVRRRILEASVRAPEAWHQLARVVRTLGDFGPRARGLARGRDSGGVRPRRRRMAADRHLLYGSRPGFRERDPGVAERPG